MMSDSPKQYGHRPEHISDDDQRERDGVHPTEYDLEGTEAVAQRDELERQVEVLVRDAESWLQNTKDPDAQSIYNLMTELYERLGKPPESSEAIAREG